MVPQSFGLHCCIFYITILQIIQRLLEEKLTTLQCAVFDKSLADLKTRMEKVECNKRHKTVLTEMQVSVYVFSSILRSNAKTTSSMFSSKVPRVASRETIVTLQGEEVVGGAANANVPFELQNYFPAQKEGSNQLIIQKLQRVSSMWQTDSLAVSRRLFHSSVPFRHCQKNSKYENI